MFSQKRSEVRPLIRVVALTESAGPTGGEGPALEGQRWPTVAHAWVPGILLDPVPRTRSGSSQPLLLPEPKLSSAPMLPTQRRLLGCIYIIIQCQSPKLSCRRRHPAYNGFATSKLAMAASGGDLVEPPHNLEVVGAARAPGRQRGRRAAVSLLRRPQKGIIKAGDIDVTTSSRLSTAD